MDMESLENDRVWGVFMWALDKDVTLRNDKYWTYPNWRLYGP